MLAQLEILLRSLPAAVSAGAATGGTATVAAAATSGSLATAGVLGGAAAILGTAGGLVIQWRRVAAEDVPALRRRLKAAESALARAERKHDSEAVEWRGETEDLRANLLRVERALYSAERVLARREVTAEEEA